MSIGPFYGDPKLFSMMSRVESCPISTKKCPFSLKKTPISKLISKNLTVNKSNS